MEITHFSHRHPLICSDEITQEVECPGCGLPVSAGGPAYICAENFSPCKYFSIHKSCAELPEQILSHPFHQHHPPLILKKNSRCRTFFCSLCDQKCSGFKFSCSNDSCDFELDAACASLRPYSTHDEENDHQGIIEQFWHKHPLISVTFPEGKRNLMKCKCCRIPIKGGLMIYACLECRFLIHKSCAKLPKQIQRHPFHPQHDLYLEIYECVHYNYSCSVCWGFWSDTVRSMLTMLGNKKEEEEEEEEEQRLEWFSHEHPLTQLIRCLDDEEKDMVANKITCYVCSLSLINDTECTFDGSMKFYVCFDCGCFIHKSCVELPREIPSHPLHPSESLTLKPEASSELGSKCGLCGVERFVHMYQSPNSGFALHVTCAMLIPTISNEQFECRIQHRSHKHSLIPLPVLDRQKINFARLICFGCESTLSDSSYVCCECRFFLCKLCAEEFLEEILQHPFHPQHPLTFFDSTTTSSGKPYCKACDEIHFGFVYHCVSCQFYLGLKCASLPTIKYELHEHPLTFFNHKSNFLCQNCRKPCQKFFLRCVRCDLNLHVKCIPALPTTAKVRTHRHLLTLTDPHPEKGRKDYCDACEEERNPDLFVYYCVECDFVAHIECRLSQEEANIPVEEEGSYVGKDSLEEEEDSSGKEQSLVVRQIRDAGFGVFPYYDCSDSDFSSEEDYLWGTSDDQEEDDADNVSLSSSQLENAIEKHTRILNKLLQQRARHEAYKNHISH